MKEIKSIHKTVRLTPTQSTLLDQRIRHTGMSFSELIEKKILNPDNTNEIINQIEWESEQLQEFINKNFIALHGNFKTLDEHIKSKSQDYMYSYFGKLELSQNDMQKTSSYKHGDLLRTHKNNLLVVSSIEEDNKKLKVSLLPLTQNSEIRELQLSSNEIKEAYRR
ncbi:MAG: hypothetical protein K8R44_05710 [Sulfurimonas sp.]|nr:hypothetical protein [Sulfurimonas sp.]